MNTPATDFFSTATLIRVHNPFDVSEQERELLPLSKDVRLGDLITVEDHYSVSVNGALFEDSDWREYQVIDGDYVVLCPVPGGGGGPKNILRVVALIAISIAAPYAAAGILGTTVGSLGAAGYALSAGITIAGSMVVNSLIPIEESIPTAQSLEDSSPSYGIDGPKNSAKEGIPVPVVYGTYRVGGNIINLHTENVNEDDEGTQNLYMQFALSEGEVAAIRADSILINDQPYSNFDEVDVETRTGTANQKIVPWFDDVVSPYTVGVTLSQTPHIYTTQTVVDKIRVDLVAPQGFRQINDQGESLAISRPLTIEYKQVGEPETAWRKATSTTLNATGTKQVAVIGDTEYELSNLPAGYSVSGNSLIKAQYYDTTYSYRSGKDGGSTTYGNLPGSYYGGAPSSGKDMGSTGNNWTLHSKTSKSPVSSLGSSGTATFVRYVKVGDLRTVEDITQATVMYGKHTSAYRASFAWPVEQPGLYEVRIKRDSAESADSQIIDAIHWADTNEILVSEIPYKHTALLALKVRLTDQLSSRPKVTVIVDGRKIRIPQDWYEVGNPWVEEHSTNPAWIALDAITNSRYGLGYGDDRINMADWMKWAAYCDEMGLEFNGIFDTDGNFWDALAHVFRAGRAKIVQQGVRYGVAIERPEFPAMMFNVSNMKKSTLNINWLSMSDRANEIQATYYDENDDYKARVLKVVSPALQQGANPRVVNLNLIGVTNPSQARQEAQLLLNMNRFIQQTITFEAPVDALACRVGSLVLVQHDIPQWGFGGRTVTGSTTNTIKLDRSVTIESGKSYTILLNFDSLMVSSGLLGPKINDYNFFIEETYAREGSHALIVNGNEYAVRVIYSAPDEIDGIPRKILTLEDFCPALEGDSYELYRLDALEERDITNLPGETDELTLYSPMPSAPGAYVKWLFGVLEGSQKQFRVLSIEGEGIHTRKLTCVEYYDAIYNDDSVIAEPPNYSALPSAQQVTNLTADQVRRVIGGVSQPVIRLEWDGGDNYGGAYVYVKSGTENWQQVTRAEKTQSSFEFTDLILGETLSFRVVAIDPLGAMADKKSAPTVSHVVTTAGEVLVPPVITLCRYTGDGILLEWTNPDTSLYLRTEVFRNTVNDSVTATKVFGGNAEQFVDRELISGQTHYYWLRSVNTDNVAGVLSAVISPGALGQISNLRLKSAFIGDAAEIVWDAQPGAAAYQVEVRTKNVLRRSERVTANEYRYSVEDAIADGDVDRDIVFTVWAISPDNDTAASTTLAVSNPAPSLPVSLTVVPGFKTIILKFLPPSDTDYVATTVWIDTVANFTVSDANKIATVAGGPITITDLALNTTYYVRMTSEDVWGPGAVSIDYEATTHAVQEGLSPWAYVTAADRAFIDANLTNDAIASEKIVSLTASRITAGTIGVTEKISVEGQIESVTAAGTMNVTVGPKLVDGKIALISAINGTTPIFQLNEDGSSNYSGPITITGGTGYSALSDKPTSLSDISTSEGGKLGGIAPGADVTGSNTAADTAKVNGRTASAVTTGIDTAQSTADSKALTFYQTTTPTGASVNDLWYNPDTQVMKRYTGSVWQDVSTFSDQNAVANGSSLFINGDMTMVAKDGRPAGLKACYSSVNPAIISYQNAAKTIAKVQSSDTSTGVAFPAVRVASGGRYGFFMRIKANTAATSGFYFRLQEYDAELPFGITHVSHNGGEAGVVVATRQRTGYRENAPIGTAWEEYYFEYEPTATAKWVSPIFLNWDGMSTRELHIDAMQIYPLATYTVNTNQLTDGAGLGQSAVWTSVASRPTTLSGLNSAEGSKLSGIAPGADVTNYADAKIANAITESGVLTIAAPGGARYSGPMSGAGALKITLPVSYTNTMMYFSVDVYEYTTERSFTLQVGGYSYTGGWRNVSARLIGSTSAENTVRFGHDGSKCCVLIGQANSNWRYVKASVRNFQAGYSSFAVSTWDNGWSIGLVTTLPTNIDATISDALLDARSIKGQGALATKNKADYANDIDGAKPPSNATYGAVWGSTLSGIPNRITNSATTGLNLTDSYMGYYNAGWKTYIASNGSFHFGSSTNNFIDYNGSKLVINTDNLTIDAAGNASFSGTITGSTVTGSTLQTSPSGERIIAEASTNTIKFYNSSNSLEAVIGSVFNGQEYTNINLYGYGRGIDVEKSKASYFKTTFSSQPAIIAKNTINASVAYLGYGYGNTGGSIIAFPPGNLGGASAIEDDGVASIATSATQAARFFGDILIMRKSTSARAAAGLAVQGDFYAGGVKNFRIAHPFREGKFVYHGAYEGPVAGGNIYRYEVVAVGNKASIELPEYFSDINKDVMVFCQPDKHFGNAYGEILGNVCEITSDSDGKYFIVIYGTRCDKGITGWRGDIRDE